MNYYKEILPGRQYRWWGTAVFCLALALLPAPSGWAQNPGVEQPEIQLPSGGTFTARVFVGFDPQYPFRRQLTWVPVTFEVNNGNDEIQGRIVSTLKNGREVFSIPVQMSPRSQKNFSMFVYIPELLDEMEFYLDTQGELIPMEIITVTTGLMETNRYIAALTPSRGTHEHLEDLTSPDIDMSVTVVYADPQLMPRGWIGYMNIDALLWDEGSTVSLAPTQEQALDQWIQMGGTLIIAAGENWQELNESPYQLYMPITITGSQVLPQGTEITSPHDTSIVKLANSWVAATGELLKDPNIKIWLQAGDIPFLIERKWGAGRIIWLATSLQNPLFDDPAYNESLINFLIMEKPPLNTDVVTQMDPIINRFLRWMVQAELPGTWFIASYLGIYILLIVPVNYLIFRTVGRLEWAWLTVPIWAIVFAYGAYYIGALRQQSFVTVHEISILEAYPNAKTARGTTYSSIYSPVRRRYTLNFTDPVAYPLNPVEDNLRGGGSQIVSDMLNVTFVENDQTQVDDFLIYHWSQRILKTEHHLNLGGGVDIQIQRQGNLFSGTISNNSSYTLDMPKVYFEKQEYTLQKNLQPGETLDVELEYMENFAPMEIANRLNGWANYMRGQPRTFDFLIDDYIKQAYPALYMLQNDFPSTGVFLATINEPQLVFDIQGESIEPGGKAVLSVIFNYEHLLSGRRITVPASWEMATIDTKRTGTLMRAPGYGIQGMSYTIQGQQGITIAGIMPNEWQMLPQFPLQQGKVLSLNIIMEYGFIRYAETDQQHLLNSGMRQPPPYEKKGDRPADTRYELHLYDRVDKEFKPLSEISDEINNIEQPERFIENGSGAIRMKMFPYADDWLFVPREALKIQMTIDYDQKSGFLFLGRPLLTVAEDLRYDIPKGGENDTD
ncbi:MAG: hypothetical protein ACOX5R_16790 [bacterium]|jgi:hypothetical protein